MLDSLQEAQRLCAMHGYETAVQAGLPVVLLLKVRPLAPFRPGRGCRGVPAGSALGAYGGRAPPAPPLQGAYVDPPPPVPRKRSEIISGMAPGAHRCAPLLAALGRPVAALAFAEALFSRSRRGCAQSALPPASLLPAAWLSSRLGCRPSLLRKQPS